LAKRRGPHFGKIKKLGFGLTPLLVVCHQIARFPSQSQLRSGRASSRPPPHVSPISGRMALAPGLRLYRPQETPAATASVQAMIATRLGIRSRF
jgi:hypothetical protein